MCFPKTEKDIRNQVSIYKTPSLCNKLKKNYMMIKRGCIWRSMHFIYICVFWYFSSSSHQDAAPVPPRSLLLTLVEESGATQLWCKPLHLHPQSPSSPLKKRPRKSRRTLQKRFSFTYWLSGFQCALWSLC